MYKGGRYTAKAIPHWAQALGMGASNDLQHVDHILLFRKAASALDRTDQLMHAGVEIAAQTPSNAPAANQADPRRIGIEPHSQG
jgi:hypothetical protein